MRNDRIRYIKRHCFSFNIGDIQKQYYRNGDLTYRENYTKKLTPSEIYTFDSGGGTWDYSDVTGNLDYLSVNGEGFDYESLDLYSLIKIDTDDELNLYAMIPYNIVDDVSFEIDNNGMFIIIEN